MKIIAIIAVYNEELHLPYCLEHLWAQGIQTYIIDNGSIDRTPEIARSFLNRGVIHLERFSRPGMFELDPLLRRKEEIALELKADWYIHHDADEIRHAPNPHRTLAEGVLAVDRAGYNAINFDEFVFIPTGPDENYEHGGFVEEMQYYYFFEPMLQRRINAWKNFGQQIDLHNSGGHQVQFQGRRVYPHNFIMRHYMALSHAHIIRKYCGRIRSEVERREKGWGNERASLHPDQIPFPERNRLRRVSTDNTWDCSDPWKVHAIFEKVSLLPREGEVGGKETIELRPPAPFIVGVEDSGAVLLRLMLNSHPDWAILPETRFIPEISRQWRETKDQREFFLQALVKQSTWKDFHIDPNVLRTRIAAINPSDLTQLLRAFYKLYAENSNKPRWGDGTLGYVISMELIQKLIPEARFIHVIRDGRDVVQSHRNNSSNPHFIEEAASQWVWTIAQARRQAQNLNHYLEIQYEKLTLNPTDTLKQICEFISLPGDPAMLSYQIPASGQLMEFDQKTIAPRGDKVMCGAKKRLTMNSPSAPRLESNRIGNWRNEMTISEKKAIEAIAATMLRELGYELE